MLGINLGRHPVLEGLLTLFRFQKPRWHDVHFDYTRDQHTKELVPRLRCLTCKTAIVGPFDRDDDNVWATVLHDFGEKHPTRNGIRRDSVQ